MNTLDKKIIDTFKDLAIENIKTLETNKAPYFKFKVRLKSNTLFDNKKKILGLGDRTEIRTYLNPSQVKKYMQLLAVMDSIKKEIEEGKIITLRDLFYLLKIKLGNDVDEQIFEEQNQSNSIAVDLEVLTGFSREELHIVSNPRAFVVGNIIAEEKFQGKSEKIDFSKGASAGIAVAPNPEAYTFKKVDADYVLFCEKYAVFSRLNQEGFPQKHRAIIVTSSGYPARSARLFTKRLHEEFKLPVYILNDSDEDGLNISQVLQIGSIALSWLSDRMAIPDAKFLGLKLSDIYSEPDLKYITEKNLTMALSKHDEKKIKTMLNNDWVKGSNYEKELKLMLEKKVKVESDVLASKNYKILEDYIVKNIKNKNWIEYTKK